MFTEAQYAVYARVIVDLINATYLASSRHVPDMTIWLSTDHFTTPPPLKAGDVGHVGLWDLLDHIWPLIATSDPTKLLPWSVAVHPYDAGDPRQNLTSQGIYTFATLAENVADVQCGYLQRYAGVQPSDCGSYPHTAMWASEQGWPQGPGVNKTVQARNICYAHGLSLAQGVYAVSHNLFQSSTPSSQGGSGDFSLVDEPPVCFANLTTCSDFSETYRAYEATAPGVYGTDATNYCCARWGWGCPGAAQ
jgi:hypothetical protein